MSIFVREPVYGGVSIIIEAEEVLVHRRTQFQEVIIADTPAFGRALFLDGHVQSTAADEAMYHELLVHPGMVIHGGPRRVLIGGTGEGATLREVLRHRGVERVVTVDVDSEVVELCREHLPEWSAGAFDDPRVESRTEDFLATLAGSAAGAWDLVIADLTDPVEEGPSVALWSVPYFTEIRRVLASDGLLVVQSGEADPVDLATLRTVRSTLAAVFPYVDVAMMMVPSFHCMWSFVVASTQPLPRIPGDLGPRIAGRAELAGLRVYSRIAHEAALTIPPFLAEMLQEPGKVITEAEAMVALTLPAG